MPSKHTSASESTPARRAARRPTQAERRARTRADLLSAAYGVFVARGYTAASLDEIAEAAGYSKGALYYNFASKEALFLALVEQRMEEREGRLAAAGAVASRTAQGGEDGGGGGEAGWGPEAMAALPVDRDWTLLFFEFVTYAARNSAVAEAFAERLARMRAQASAVLERIAEDRGTPLPLPAEPLARGLSALANGMAIEALLSPDSEEGALSALLGRLVEQVLAPPAPD